MGTGADVVMERAAFKPLGGDLMGIVARKLAKATLRTINQNRFFAFAYNSAGIPVSAGVLYPTTETVLSPIIAAAEVSLWSDLMIADELRLRRVLL